MIIDNNVLIQDAMDHGFHTMMPVYDSMDDVMAALDAEDDWGFAPYDPPTPSHFVPVVTDDDLRDYREYQA